MKKISKLFLVIMLLLTFFQLNFFKVEDETKVYQLADIEVPGPQSVDFIR